MGLQTISEKTQICDNEFLKFSTSYVYSKYLFWIFENIKRRTIFSYFVRLQQNRNATDITISVVSSGGHLGTSLKIAPYIYRNATVFKLRLMTKWDDWCQNILHAALTHFPNCALMAWQRSTSYFAIRTKKILKHLLTPGNDIPTFFSFLVGLWQCWKLFTCYDNFIFSLNKL